MPLRFLDSYIILKWNELIRVPPCCLHPKSLKFSTIWHFLRPRYIQLNNDVLIYTVWKRF